MKRVLVGLALAALAGCGDDDDGGGTTIDAAAGGADSAPGTIDAAPGQPDAAPPAIDAGGPVNVQCADLPVTLQPMSGGGNRIDFGTICYQPAGLADPVTECRVVDDGAALVDGECNHGGVLLGAATGGATPGGEVLAGFGAGTNIEATSAGTISGTNKVVGIPDGPVTVDFRGGFSTGNPSATVHRVVLTFNADGSLTVTSLEQLP